MRCVVEVVPSILLHEVLVLEPQDVAVAHGELEHHGGGEPKLILLPSVPSLDACDHFCGRPHVSWSLRPERWEVELGDFPSRIVVVWLAPLREHASKLAYIAPGREARNASLHECRERGVDFLSCNRRYRCIQLNVRCTAHVRRASNGIGNGTATWSSGLHSFGMSHYLVAFDDLFDRRYHIIDFLSLFMDKSIL